MAEFDSVIRIRVDTSRAEAGITTVDARLNRLGRTANRTRQSTNSLGDSLGQLKGILSGVVIGSAIKSVVVLADEYVKLTARIGLVTSSTEDLLAVQEDVLKIANQTGQTLGATTQTYVRIANATKGLGFSSETTSKAVAALADSFRISGSTAIEAAQSSIQLAQGLGAGALRGDEFRSVSETNIRVMEALADSMDVAQGSLKTLAAEGKITSEVVFKALIDNAEKLREESAKIPLTVGESFTVLRNELQKTLGENEELKSGIQELVSTLVDAGPDIASGIGFAITKIIQGIKLVLAAGNDLVVLLTGSFVVSIFELGKEWDNFKLAAEIAWEGIKQSAVGTLQLIQKDFARFFLSLSKEATDLGLLDVAKQLTTVGRALIPNIDATEEYTQKIIELQKEQEKNEALFRLQAAAIIEAVKEDFKLAAAIDAIITVQTKLDDVNSKAGKAAIARRLQDKAARAELVKSNTVYADLVKILKLQNAQIGFSKRQLALYVNVQKLSDKQNKEQVQSIKDLTNEYFDLAEAQEMSVTESEAFIKSIEDFDSIKEKIDPSIKVMRELGEEISIVEKIADAGLISPEVADDFIKELERMSAEAAKTGDEIQNAFAPIDAGIQTFGDSASKTIGILRDMSEEGSSTYEALTISLQALNAVQAISAVVLQLSAGDVYSAIPRAAAAAAAVASLGLSVGGSFSEADTTSENRQAAQGTGTVLGDAAAKSESLLKAMEITATATSALVNINTGMLDALVNLQQGIAGGSARIAQSSSDVSFIAPSIDSNGLQGVFGDTLGGAVTDILDVAFFGLGSVLGNLLSGSAKQIDDGIRIWGGTINDLATEAIVDSFGTFKVKKNVFSSTKTREQFVQLGEEVSVEFETIFTGISNSVRQGALALGIAEGTIQDALNEFVIETQQISLRGLSPERVAEELNAVFGVIFDNLAGAVVPNLEQFRVAGEGLGQTLARVASNVQVTKEVLLQFGAAQTKVNETTGETTSTISFLATSLDQLSGVDLIQASNDLIELTGGIEKFASATAQFVSNFATDEQKLAIATDSVNRAFAAMGEQVPESTEALFDLFNAQDASTKAGRQNIAILLRIQDAAKEYYDLLETASEKAAAAAKKVLDNELQAIEDAAAIKAELEAKKAADAAEVIETVITAIDKAADSFERLKVSVVSTIDGVIDSISAQSSVANTLPQAIDQVNRLKNAFENTTGQEQLRNADKLARAGENWYRLRIGGLENEKSVIEQNANDEINRRQDIFQDQLAAYERQKAALDSLKDFASDLLLDSQLSPLTNEERIEEARRQFEEAKVSGDPTQVQDAAQKLLQEGRSFFSSSDEFTTLFADVKGTLDKVAGQAIRQPSLPNTDAILTRMREDTAVVDAEIAEVTKATLEELEGLKEATDAIDFSLDDQTVTLGEGLVKTAELIAAQTLRQNEIEEARIVREAALNAAIGDILSSQTKAINAQALLDQQALELAQQSADNIESIAGNNVEAAVVEEVA